MQEIIRCSLITGAPSYFLWTQFKSMVLPVAVGSRNGFRGAQIRTLLFGDSNSGVRVYGVSDIKLTSNKPFTLITLLTSASM